MWALWESRVLWCAVKGKSTQLVQVQPKEVSVHLGSYSGDGKGDRPIEAPRTKARRRTGQQAYGPQRE
jgi:hypothetical protein